MKKTYKYAVVGLLFLIFWQVAKTFWINAKTPVADGRGCI